jgi:hypothetical protein
VVFFSGTGGKLSFNLALEEDIDFVCFGINTQQATQKANSCDLKTAGEKLRLMRLLPFDICLAGFCQAFSSWSTKHAFL